ncbi:carboxypeptidase-like regulatory domain-containing protein [Nemorincola caseinilytica]|uniref:Carboxypeptidase-like regulatory domain-containing protein n=1 Tax=Nemorincola caseinilytica TaxID=2054315 RepID=A0ABP8N4R8_9BACT
MRHKAFFAFVFLILFSTITYAEGDKTAILKGKAYNSATKTPLYDVKVSIPDLKIAVATDGDGDLSISEVPYGTHTLIFNGGAVVTYTMTVVVNKDLVDIGDVMLTLSEKANATDNTEIPTITVEDNTANQDDDGSSAQNSSGMFVAGQDAFTAAVAYTFGQYYFKPRGGSGYELQLNGITIEDVERGYSSWGQLGGLSDVLHGRSVTYGLQPSGYAYGGLNGTTYIDATAADQRKGSAVTYTRYNRNYRNRVMMTHNSGLMKNKWAWSVSGSRRWAEEGYTPGTFYDGYSFYGAASKVIGKGQLNLTAMYSPTRRGRALNATDEVYGLTNNNQYNSAWGYQNGVKRNSRVVDVSQPIFIANYTYRPSDKTRWNTAIGYETGRYKSSTIDFYNAYSPRPDYYRNLPSYYYSMVPPQPQLGDSVKALLMANPEMLQVDWAKFYEANRMNIETIKNVNGVAGDNVTGKRSMYVLSNFVDELRKFTFNTNIEHAQSEHLTLMGGARFVMHQNESYKELVDLLGGDFYLNTYQFLDAQNTGNTSYAQNNLNEPNKLIKTGDKYGYDYILRNMQTEVWGQTTATLDMVDLFGALNVGHTSFSREGLYKNGLFPNNSFGKSEAHGFFTYKAKAGAALKLGLHNIFYVNADHTEEAPLMSNTYISQATRDFVINAPTTIKTNTLEAGYMLRTHRVNLRFTGYVTDAKDITSIRRFFYDELGTQAFISYVMNKVSTRATGIEFAANYKISSMWSLTGVASVGQYFYTNSPDVNIYLDNDPAVATTSHKTYINNYYVGNGPQSVYSMALSYRPGRWTIASNINYIDRNYIDIYPDRRTASAVALVTPGSPQWHSIIDQERMPSAYTVDLYVSRSFSTSRYTKKFTSHSTSLFVSLGINNLLDKRDIKVAGYEQLRYDFGNRSTDKFLNYYDYAFGLNYSANISFRF